MPKNGTQFRLSVSLFVCATFWTNCWNIVQIVSTARFYARDAGAAPAIPLTVARLCGFFILDWG